MTRLADIINTFGDDFRAQYRDRLTSDHLQALAAIKHCRSEASPKMQVACTACDHRSLVPHSCGHRHCPHCQHHESQQWLERQMQRLVPADYFLVTFTLPAQFRPLAAAHPRIAYDLLMKSAWETVRTFSLNDRQLQGAPGAIAVLHTHSRRLDYHQHVHLVVPAAAVDAEKARWRTKRRKGKGYLFSHQALAKVFRAKMLAGADFLWLVLQHVLPKGFRRARNFGFLHPNCKRLIALLHLLLKFVPRAAAEWVKARAPILCACCGAVMAIVRTRIPPLRAGGPAMPPVVRGAF